MRGRISEKNGVDVVSAGDLSSDTIHTSSEGVSNKKDIISSVSLDVLADNISQYLDHKTLASSMEVSKGWNGLFHSINAWKRRLIVDFNITIKILNEVENKHNNPAIFILLYKQLHFLKRKQHAPNRHAEVDNLLRNPGKHAVVVACCLDDEKSLLDNLSRDDYESCLIFAMHLGSDRVTKALLEIKKSRVVYSFAVACQAGNLNIVRYILGNPAFKITKNVNYLYKAALSGNKKLVKFLLEESGLDFVYDASLLLESAMHEGDQYLDLIKYIVESVKYTSDDFSLDTFLDAIARTGNKEVLAYLCELAILDSRKSGISGMISAVIDYFKQPQDSEDLAKSLIPVSRLRCACASGNIDLVKHLLDDDTKYKVEEIYPSAFMGVAVSGNIDLLIYLLNHRSLVYDNNPSQNRIEPMLNIAIQHGNIEFVQYLLDPKNKFDLHPTQESLKHAACTGSVKLVSYFLDPKNGFGLTPDSTTLENAIHSSCPELVFYFLDKNNGFNINLGDLQENSSYEQMLKLNRIVLGIYIAERLDNSGENSARHGLLQALELEIDPEVMKIINLTLEKKYNVNDRIPLEYRMVFASQLINDALDRLKNDDDQFASYLLQSFSLSPRVFINNVSSILAPSNLCPLEETHINKLKDFIGSLPDFADALSLNATEKLLIEKLQSKMKENAMAMVANGENSIVNTSALRP